MSNQTEIALSEQMTKVLSQIVTEIQGLQKQVEQKNSILSNFITGICLNEGLDLQAQGVNLSEDLKTLLVYNLPTEASAKEVTPNPVPAKTTKAKRAKL